MTIDAPEVGPDVGPDVAPEVVEDEQSLRLGEALAAEGERRGRGGSEAAPPEDEVVEEVVALSPTAVCAAAFLSAAAAGIVCGGIFAGVLPRLVAVAATGVGAGLIWVSTRVRRPSTVQFAVPVVAVVSGALLVMPDSTGGTANLPSLVAEALQAGGISQPPVPFDPGWRFLLVVAMTLLAAAAAALAVGLNRSKVAVFLPVPVVFGGLAAQPDDASIVTTLAALALVVGALTVSFGAELRREGATSSGFELRRFAKGAVALAGLVLVLAAMTRVGALFPAPDEDQVVPPKRPSPSPAEPDRELFTVAADRKLPWRVGVLDGYDGEAWLTPPFDTSRFVEVPDGEPIRVAGEAATREGVVTAPARPGTPTAGESETVTATFTITDVRGHVVPTPANPTSVDRGRTDIEFDPRTQTLRLPDERAPRGMSYTVVAPNPPHAADLVGAPAPPASMQTYLDVPAPPPEVVDLLNRAPAADDFTRLQFVRQKLYEVVVAKGTGQPTPVPPERVAELLAGVPGTPFEITATEALLARWVGVPSRIGFGYFGGDEKDEGRASIRPRHAGTWLEVYFEGYSWVPIVGTPPRAQGSLDAAQQNANSAIRPTDNLTLPAYVPMRAPTIQLLYVLVQYWVARTVPYIVLALLTVWLYPGALKIVRRMRRRRWARQGEPADRVRVAYAEFRDVVADYNVGSASLTPLELVDVFESDVEHRELAWLVTRALWGDLYRDLRDEDIEAAEEMARSMTGRLRSVQPVTARALAFASRASLRRPFSDEMPNVWWPEVSLRSRARRRLRQAVRGAVRSVRRPIAAVRRPAPATAAAIVALLAVLSSGCVQDVDVRGAASAPLPDAVVPDALGDVRFTREPSVEGVFTNAGPERLVGDVRVFTARRGDDVLGAVQVAAFKETLSERRGEVRSGILEALGGDRLELTRLGRDAVYKESLVDRQLFVWFAPKEAYYAVFVARKDFEEAGQLFANLLAFQRGERPDQVVPVPADPRRGFQG